MAFKTRYWTVITYPESFDQVKVELTAQNLSYGRCKYAYVLHDQDVYEEGHEHAGEPKKPHIHWCIEFPTPHEEKYVNVIFNTAKSIPMGYDKTLNYRYLLHLDDADKARYPPSAIHSNHDVYALLDITEAADYEHASVIDEIMELASGEVSYVTFYRRHPEWLYKAQNLHRLVDQFKRQYEGPKMSTPNPYTVQKYRQATQESRELLDRWYQFNNL